MKTFGKTALVLAVAVLAGSLAHGDDKIDKTKLVGVWKVTKGEDAPPGATAEFTKDGKLIVMFEENGKKEKMEGTYSIDGDKLTVALKKADNEDKDIVTVKSLSADKLVIENKMGKTIEFEKMK
jgi:uncharacterized protein (TIGR03066 family)